MRLCRLGQHYLVFRGRPVGRETPGALNAWAGRERTVPFGRGGAVDGV
jgi:hypothetical protein